MAVPKCTFEDCTAVFAETEYDEASQIATVEHVSYREHRIAINDKP